MTNQWLGAVAAALATTATTPLDKAVRDAGGLMCFERSYDSAWLAAHKGQHLTSARLALSADDNGNAKLRMTLTGSFRPYYLYGSCNWYSGDLNRDVQGEVLDPTFKFATGVGCHLFTDTTGASAEEGGDFPVAWEDHGRVLQVHLPDGFAAWPSADVSRNAGFRDLGAKDRIIRLRQVYPEKCEQLVKSFAPNGI
jgi:hypothetical protein